MELFTSKNITDDILKRLDLYLVKISRTELNYLNEILSFLKRNDGTSYLENLKFTSRCLTDNELNFLNDKLSFEYKNFYTKYDFALAKVKIKERGEKMVSLERENLSNVIFSSEPFSDFCGEFSGKKRIFYLREGAAKKFLFFADVLSKLGFGVLVLDCYRPLKVQESLYLNTVSRVKTLNPNFSFKEIITVANARTAFAPWVAAHMSGAALDLYIFDLKTGLRLDIGNDYRETRINANINFPFLTFKQYLARFILFHVAESVGFTVYPAENWHISFGDVGDGYRKNNSAIYGPIRSFNYSDGTIDPICGDDIKKLFIKSLN